MVQCKNKSEVITLLNNTTSLTIVIYFKSDYIGFVRAGLPLYFYVYKCCI